MASPSRLPGVHGPNASPGKRRPMSMMIEPGSLQLPQGGKDRSTRRSLLPTSNRQPSFQEVIHQIIGNRDESESGDSETPPQAAVEEAKAKLEGSSRAMPPPAAKMPAHLQSMPAPANSGMSDAASRRANVRPAFHENGSRVGRPSSMISNASRTEAGEAGLSRTPSTRVPQSPRPSASTNLARQPSIKSSQQRSRTDNTNTTTSSDDRTTESRPTRRLPAPTSRSRPQSMFIAPALAFEIPLEKPYQRGSITSLKQPVSLNTPLASSRLSSSGALRSAPFAEPSSSRPYTTSMMQPPSRPMFSTFQQHYSPAKKSLPKPPIPNVRPAATAITIPDVSTAMTFEVARLQVELLQLSILHQASTATMQKYSASAKRKLRSKHTALLRAYGDMQALEQENRRDTDLAVLAIWCDPVDLNENLQLLDRAHSELSRLSEPDGRFTELVSTFDAWIEDAERSTPPGKSGQRGFISALPMHWRQVHGSLALKVRSLQRDLSMLPAIPSEHSDSSLAVVLRRCNDLVSGTLVELEYLVRLESHVLEREKQRIEDEVAKVTVDSALLLKEEREAWVPAWQQVP